MPIKCSGLSYLTMYLLLRFQLLYVILLLGSSNVLLYELYSGFGKERLHLNLSVLSC